MNERLKDALLTRPEAAAAIGFDLNNPEWREEWQLLITKARKKGFVRQGGGSRKTAVYTYDDLKWLKTFLLNGGDRRHAKPRADLIDAARRQLEADGL